MISRQVGIGFSVLRPPVSHTSTISYFQVIIHVIMELLSWKNAGHFLTVIKTRLSSESKFLKRAVTNYLFHNIKFTLYSFPSFCIEIRQIAKLLQSCSFDLVELGSRFCKKIITFKEWHTTHECIFIAIE